MNGSFPISRAACEVLGLREFIRRMEESGEEIFSVHLPVSSLLILSEEICLTNDSSNLLSELSPLRSSDLRSFLSVCELDDVELLHQLVCFQSYLRAILNLEISTTSPYIEFSYRTPHDPFWSSSDVFVSLDLFEGIEEGFAARFLECYQYFMEVNNFFTIGTANFGSNLYRALLVCLYFSFRHASDSAHVPIVNAPSCRVIAIRLLSRITTRLNQFASPGLFTYFVRECFLVSGLILAAFSDVDGSQVRLSSWSSNAGNFGIIVPIFEILTLFALSREVHSDQSMCRLFMNLYSIDGRTDSQVEIDFIASFHLQNIIPRLSPNFAAVWRPWFRYCRRRMRSFLLLQDSLTMSTRNLVSLRMISSLSAGVSILALSESLESLTDLQRVECLGNALLRDRGPACGRNCLDWVLFENIFARFSVRSSVFQLIEERIILLRGYSISRSDSLQIETFRELIRFIPFHESNIQDFCSVFFTSHRFLSILDGQITHSDRVNALWSALFCLFARSSLSELLLGDEQDVFWRQILSLFESLNTDRGQEGDADPGEGPSTAKRRRI